MCYKCFKHDILTWNEILKEKIKKENRYFLEENVLLDIKNLFVPAQHDKEFSNYVDHFLKNYVFKDSTINVGVLKNGHNSVFIEHFDTELRKQLNEEKLPDTLSKEIFNIYINSAHTVELIFTSLIYTAGIIVKDESLLKNFDNTILNIEDDNFEAHESLNKIFESSYYEITHILHGNFENICNQRKNINIGFKIALPEFDFVKNKKEYYMLLENAIELIKLEESKIKYNQNYSYIANDFCLSHYKSISKTDNVENDYKSFLKFEKDIIKEDTIDENILTPLEISNELKKAVKGQNEAVEILSLSAYQQLMRKNGYINNRNKIIDLIIGDSGTGKTLMVRELASILGLPYKIIPVTSISAEGWHGDNLSSVLLDAYDQDDGEFSLIFFDEIDKLSFFQDDRQHNQINRTLQNELLTVIEGQVYENGTDTKNMMFIFGGSFDDFVNKKEKTIGYNAIEIKHSLNDKVLEKKDFLKFGLRKELLGRIQNIMQLKPFTDDVLKEILFAKNGFLEYYEEYFKGHEKEIEWSPCFIEHVIDIYKEENDEFGARFFNDVLYKLLKNIMTKVALEEQPNKKESLLITKDSLS